MTLQSTSSPTPQIIAKNKFSHTLKRIAIWLATIILSIYLLIWALSPLVARWQINQQLHPYQLHLSDNTSVRFNPFLLKLSLSDVELASKDFSQTFVKVQSAVIDLDAIRLFSKQIHFESIQFNDIQLMVQRSNTQINVAGFDLLKASDEQSSLTSDMPDTKDTAKKEATQSELNKPWVVSSDQTQFENILIKLTNFEHHHQLRISNLALNQTQFSLDKQAVKIELSAFIDEAPFKVNLSMQRKDNQGEVLLDLELEQFQLEKIAYLLKPDIEKLRGKLSLSLTQSVIFEGDKLTVKLPKLKVVLDKAALSTAGLNITTANFTSIITNLLIENSQHGIKLANADLELLNRETKVTLANNGDQLVSFQQFELKHAKLSVDVDFIPTTNIDEIVFDQLIISQKAPLTISTPAAKNDHQPLAQIEKLSLKNLKLLAQHLSLTSIEIANLNSSVILDQQKQLTNLVLLSPNPHHETAPEVSKKGKDESMVIQTIDEPSGSNELTYTFSLDQFLIKDNSQITFKDASVTPQFIQVLQLNKFEIGAIDNRIKDQKTPFDIVFKTDAYAAAELKGYLKPFAEKLNIAVDIKVSEFSLPAVSPYISNAMGFDMQSGQFDTQSNIAVTDNLISGNTHLAVRGLELSSDSISQGNTLKEQSAMPLNSALNLLMDDKGNLELDIPLSGDMNSPQFGMSTFIAIVSKKAIMSSAKSYLMKALFPYSDVLSVVMVAGEYLLKVKFENLVYAPAMIDPQPEQLAFIDKFIRLLKDKPDTQIKVCAIATQQDLLEDSSQENLNQNKNQAIEKLKIIAQQRGQAFKTWIVEKGQISSSRLLLCQPRVDLVKNALPRIEFKI